MALIPFRGKSPTVAPTAWVAPGASVIGDTELGEHVSIWFGAVLRGDVNYISIGSYTNIQDNAVVHVTTGGNPTVIGSGVTIGHGAIIHACTVEDGALVGMGATVLDGAVIKAGAMVAAGALVSPGKVVESGWLWAGIPARAVRELTEKEKDYLQWSATHYAMLAGHYAEQS